MKLPDFKVEQWMNEHEMKAVYNLTDTCVSPLTVKELFAMDQDQLFMQVRLDYGTITGDARLKKEIISMYDSGTEENITLMQGCLQANETVMYTLLERGDRVIVFEPGYQQFSDIPRSIGCDVISLQLREENGWQPSIEELKEAMKDNVKMIIVNQPSNPTGVLFSSSFVSCMIEMAKEQGTYILSDEVYRGLRGEASLSDLYDRAVSTSSLSKVFSLAGLRLGWIKASEDIIRLINIRRDYSIISTGPLIDTLALAALKNREAILERSRKIIDANLETAQAFIAQHPGLHIVMPKSGTVGFLGYDAKIDDTQLALDLLDRYGLFFVPGSCFGCEKHLRLGFTCSPETMQKGLSLLYDYLQQKGRENEKENQSASV